MQCKNIYIIKTRAKSSFLDVVKTVFFQVVVVVYSHLVYVPMASREIAQFSKNMN